MILNANMGVDEYAKELFYGEGEKLAKRGLVYMPSGQELRNKDAGHSKLGYKDHVEKLQYAIRLSIADYRWRISEVAEKRRKNITGWTATRAGKRDKIVGLIVHYAKKYLIGKKLRTLGVTENQEAKIEG